MLEQIGNTIIFYFFFTASKQGKTGLTAGTLPTGKARRISDGTEFVLTISELDSADFPGIYVATLTGTNTSVESDYLAMAKTTDTSVDFQHIPALWVIGRAGIENLDNKISDVQADTNDLQARTPAALVSGRMEAYVGAMANDTLTAAALATSAVTEMQTGLATASAQTDIQSRLPAALSNGRMASDTQRIENVDASDVINTIVAALVPTVTQIVNGVWNELIAGHTVPGSMADRLAAASAASDPLLNPVPGAYASGTAGAALGFISGGHVTIQSPLSPDGKTLRLVKGDDYHAAFARALVFVDDGNWPPLDDPQTTVTFKTGELSVDGAIVLTPTQSIQIELESAQTQEFIDKDQYRLVFLIEGTEVETLVVGKLCMI